MKRRAIVKIRYPDTANTVRNYLPENYKVFLVSPPAGDSDYGIEHKDINVWIEGEDVAGWTLDDYVIPRLASGLMYAEEVDMV